MISMPSLLQSLTISAKQQVLRRLAVNWMWTLEIGVTSHAGP